LFCSRKKCRAPKVQERKSKTFRGKKRRASLCDDQPGKARPMKVFEARRFDFPKRGKKKTRNHGGSGVSDFFAVPKGKPALQIAMLSKEKKRRLKKKNIRPLSPPRTQPEIGVERTNFFILI